MSPFFGFKPGTRMFSTFRKPALLLPPAFFFFPFLRGFFGGSGPRTGPWPAKRLLFLALAFGFAFGLRFNASLYSFV